MDYGEAVGRLLEIEGFSEAELSAALNTKGGRLLQPLLDKNAEAYEDPPVGWRDGLAEFLVEEAGKLIEEQGEKGSLASEAEPIRSQSVGQREPEQRAEHLLALAKRILSER